MVDSPRGNHAIEALIFDFGGTLDSDGVAWKERFHAHSREAGLDIPAETFAPMFYAADDPLVGGLPRDAGLSDTARALTANLRREVLRCEGHSSVAAADDWSERVATAYLAESFRTFERNRPVLEALRGRYRLGIVSNFYGNLEAVCEEAGLSRYFDAIADSHRVGCEKPEPAIFHAALSQLDASPEAAIFVGDSLRRDLEGASRLGMPFVWLASPEARAIADTQGTGPLGHPTIANLGELQGLLP